MARGYKKAEKINTYTESDVTSLGKEKRNCLTAARQLGYDSQCLRELELATSIMQISRIMTSARMRLA